jgi:hypothetical protein
MPAINEEPIICGKKTKTRMLTLQPAPIDKIAKSSKMISKYNNY